MNNKELSWQTTIKEAIRMAEKNTPISEIKKFVNSKHVKEEAREILSSVAKQFVATFK